VDSDAADPGLDFSRPCAGSLETRVADVVLRPVILARHGARQALAEIVSVDAEEEEAETEDARAQRRAAPSPERNQQQVFHRVVLMGVQSAR